MRKMRVMVAVLTMVMLASGVLYAQEQKRFHKNQDEEKGKIFKELNLTPEQEKKLEENRKAQQQERQSLREAIKANHEKMQEKFKDPAVTRAAIEPLVKEINGLQAKQVESRINGIFAVKSILTPEQFVKFNEIIEGKLKDRKDRSKDRRGKFRGSDSKAE